MNKQLQQIGLKWLIGIGIVLFVILWWRNGWSAPSLYWLVPYTEPDVIEQMEGGELEAVFLSDEQPGFIKLSPSGEWLWTDRPNRQMLFRNLLTGEEVYTEIDFQYSVDGSAWLDDSIVLLDGPASVGYRLLSFKEGIMSEPLPFYPGSNQSGWLVTDDVDFVQEILQEAEQVYASTREFLFILRKNDQWQILKPDLRAQSTHLYSNLPQSTIYIGEVRKQDFPNYPWGPMSTQDIRYDSPDGTMYVKQDSSYFYMPLRGEGNRFDLSVYRTDTDERIAFVSKKVFALNPIGWSADSKTFYFQVSGRARLDASPIFALHVDNSATTAIPYSSSP